MQNTNANTTEFQRKSEDSEWSSNKGWNMAVFVPTSVANAFSDSGSLSSHFCPPACDEEYEPYDQTDLQNEPYTCYRET